MRTQSIDTTPEVERLQVARIRSFSPARKFASVRSWTYTLTSANLHAMRSGTPEPNERDIAVRFVTREYGKALATDFQTAVEQRPAWTIQEHDLLVAMIPVIEAFACLGIRYYLSGSIACSVYGLPRGAQDIDFLADIQLEHVCPLIDHLQDMILAKLDWWKLGGGVSNRQWNDILEMMKKKHAGLDIAYLRQSAPMLGVADVLEKAFNDAGLQTP